jgi:hypothetical protein
VWMLSVWMLAPQAGVALARVKEAMEVERAESYREYQSSLGRVRNMFN